MIRIVASMALVLQSALPLTLLLAQETAQEATSTRPAVGEIQAEETATSRPLLWAIGSPTTAYLLGTIHIADPRVTTLAASVADAFDSCDEVRTEIPLDAQSRAEVAKGLMLPAGQSLSDVLPEELVERIDAFLRQEGLSLEPFKNMKPWVLASLLAILDAREYMLDTSLDELLYERAIAADKSVGGLETVDEQLQIFDSMTPEEEAALVEDTLEMLQSDQDYLETLISTYIAGDAQELLKLVYEFTDDSDPIVQKYGKRLLEDRNVIMAQRIDALLQQHPTRRYFFAVGAGHMAGDSGIVQLLRDKGRVVVRLEAK